MRQLNYLSLLLSIGIYLLTSISLYSQKALLQGTISDESGETLPSATIQIGEQGTIADFDGQYSIELSEGTYQIAVSYLGYEDYESTVVLTEGSPTSLDIVLSEEVNLLQTATVTTGKLLTRTNTRLPAPEEKPEPPRILGCPPIIFTPGIFSKA